MCPFHTMAAQVAFALTVQGNAEGFPDVSRGEAVQAGMVQHLHEDRRVVVDGDQLGKRGSQIHRSHDTARASGAHHLAKAGIDLWRVHEGGRRQHSYDIREIFPVSQP